MTIIKIAANELGGHDNQSFHGVLPVGWAFLPESVGTPNTLESFPFGEISVVYAENEDGNELLRDTPTPYVASWTPGIMPEYEAPEEEPETELSVWDELDAAYLEGVDSV